MPRKKQQPTETPEPSVTPAVDVTGATQTQGAAATGQFYTPQAITFRGLKYQGGEPIPTPTPEEHEQARNLIHPITKQPTPIFFHQNPQLAAQQFQTQPVPRGEEEETGEKAPIPVVGRGRSVQSGERLIKDIPAEEAKGQGRKFFPDELTHPEVLTPEDAEILDRLDAHKAQDALDFFSNLTSPEDEGNFARLGRVARGWYKKSGEALVHLFGEHAPRFVALLASTSPQVPVARNMQLALQVWHKWHNHLQQRREQGLGMPNADETRQFLYSVSPATKTRPAGSDPIKGLMSGNHNNIIRSLLLPNEQLGEHVGRTLSGPKVESFRRNILGNLYEITNDTWQANLKGMQQAQLAGRTDPQAKDIGGNKGVKDWRYVMANLGTRRAAQILNQDLMPLDPLTGRPEEPWTPREVQEAGWTITRAISLMSGMSRRPGKREQYGLSGPLNAVDSLRQLTHGIIKGTGDFLDILFNDPETKQLLQQVKGPDGQPLASAVARLQQANATQQPQFTAAGLASKVSPVDQNTATAASIEATARNAASHNIAGSAYGRQQLQRAIMDRLRFQKDGPIAGRISGQQWGRQLTPKEKIKEAMKLLKDPNATFQDFLYALGENGKHRAGQEADVWYYIQKAQRKLDKKARKKKKIKKAKATANAFQPDPSTFPGRIGSAGLGRPYSADQPALPEGDQIELSKRSGPGVSQVQKPSKRKGKASPHVVQAGVQMAKRSDGSYDYTAAKDSRDEPPPCPDCGGGGMDERGGDCDTCLGTGTPQFPDTPPPVKKAKNTLGSEQGQVGEMVPLLPATREPRPGQQGRVGEMVPLLSATAEPPARKYSPQGVPPSVQDLDRFLETQDKPVPLSDAAATPKQPVATKPPTPKKIPVSQSPAVETVPMSGLGPQGIGPLQPIGGFRGAATKTPTDFVNDLIAGKSLKVLAKEHGIDLGTFLASNLQNIAKYLSPKQWAEIQKGGF